MEDLLSAAEVLAHPTPQNRSVVPTLLLFLVVQMESPLTVSGMIWLLCTLIISLKHLWASKSPYSRARIKPCHVQQTSICWSVSIHVSLIFIESMLVWNETRIYMLRLDSSYKVLYCMVRNFFNQILGIQSLNEPL